MSSSLPGPLLDAFNTLGQQGEQFNKEESPSNQYVAFLVELEEAQYKDGGPITFSAQFEIIPKEWVESVLVSQPEKSGRLPPPSPSTDFIFDEAPLEDIANAFKVEPGELVEGEWYMISFGSGLKGAQLKAYGSPLAKIRKAKGRSCTRTLRRMLLNWYRPIARFSFSKVLAMLDAVHSREVGVMDVGQASCNLIYDENGQPQIYVDVGLPMFFNYASLPPANGIGNVEVINPGPCLMNNPPGIITHFHWDHYDMLRRSANRQALQDRNWIFPNQNAGPAILNLINDINGRANGSVSIFPAGMANLPAGYVNIIQCVNVGGVPPDMNNTGIAVVANITKQDHHGNDIQLSLLMPGDAVFQSIPGAAAAANVRWMVASHHGSDRYFAPPPPPAPNPIMPAPETANMGRLAYSYGINLIPPPPTHCYGHPRAPAVAAYLARGWGIPNRVAATAETSPNSGNLVRGNIMMADNVIPPNGGHAHCPFHAFPKTLV